MKLDDNKIVLHLAWLIGGAFFISTFSFLLTSIFIPKVGPDGKVEMSAITILLGEMQTAMMMLGCVALGIKLTEEKKTLPSIGFTMMSIAQGVIFIMYTISLNSHEGLEEQYRVYASSMFLLIPSMILIAFYSNFPRWLNILGVVACLPMLVEIIIFSVTGKITQALILLDGSGQFLISVTASCWGLLVVRSAKNQFRVVH